ncbi:MAG: hypothetical protein FWC60_11880 [Firmicutes bacterium]|nr:hypothetical protein [Bacillota bacterium]
MKKFRYSLIGIVIIAIVISTFTVSAIAKKEFAAGIKLSDVPEYKQQVLLDEDQWFEDGTKKAQPSKNIEKDLIKPISIPPGQRGEGGILPPDAGPFSPERYTTNNMWIGSINGIDTTVYVGFCTDNVDKGFLIVLQVDGIGMKVYTPADLKGNYFIQNVKETQFTLNANNSVTKGNEPNGDKVIFDLAAESFTHSK